MPQYRAKPVFVEAVQLTWANVPVITQMFGARVLVQYPFAHSNNYQCGDPCGEPAPWLEWNHPDFRDCNGSLITCQHGMWIVRDAWGKFVIMLDHDFKHAYESAIQQPDTPFAAQPLTGIIGSVRELTEPMASITYDGAQSL